MSQYLATLKETATHCHKCCNTLQNTAKHCNTLPQTLQHTATHCNTLHHTATHTSFKNMTFRQHPTHLVNDVFAAHYTESVTVTHYRESVIRETQMHFPHANWQFCRHGLHQRACVIQIQCVDSKTPLVPTKSHHTNEHFESSSECAICTNHAIWAYVLQRAWQCVAVLLNHARCCDYRRASPLRCVAVYCSELQYHYYQSCNLDQSAIFWGKRQG